MEAEAITDFIDQPAMVACVNSPQIYSAVLTDGLLTGVAGAMISRRSRYI